MHNRQTRSFFWAGALFLGLSLTAGYALADTSTKPEPGKGGKAKTGEACKVKADCDQSSQSQSCTAGKCRAEPVAPERLPPPTT